MTPLVDGDIILHEMGWSGQFKDKETGEEVILDWDHLDNIIEAKINLICEEVGATQPPIFFVTDTEYIHALLRRFEDDGQPFQRGFRYDVATTRPYKQGRAEEKPLYFKSVLAKLLFEKRTIVSSGGLEADDELGIYQCGNPDTIICSRDKDLRSIPGWHYSWECGKQQSIGPTFTDRIGWLERKENKDVIGYGLSFFYYQMLTGDPVDTIPGLKGWGKVAAYNLLSGIKDEMGLYKAVKKAYIDTLGPDCKDYFLEQANLLWIWQKRDKGYQIPKG